MMRNRTWGTALAVSLALCLLSACTAGGNTPSEPVEDRTAENAGQAVFSCAYEGVDSTYYNSIEKFLESCTVKGVRNLMEEFPAENFEELKYYTTYYQYDDDRNFPIWVIAFTKDGARYYFSGAEKNDVFVPDPYLAQESDLVYGGSRLPSTLRLSTLDRAIQNGRLILAPDYEEFALSAETPMPSDDYFKLLAEITHDEYSCVRDGVTSIGGDAVFIQFRSHDLAGPDYTMSEAGVLREISCSFEPSTQEMRDFTTNEGEAGVDLVTTPAVLYLELAVAETGRTTVEIRGENGETLYDVDIETDSQNRAFIVENAR